MVPSFFLSVKRRNSQRHRPRHWVKNPHVREGLEMPSTCADRKSGRSVRWGSGAGRLGHLPAMLSLGLYRAVLSRTSHAGTEPGKS
jgi:hypothetical protein